jgi:hypothetical protein
MLSAVTAFGVVLEGRRSALLKTVVIYSSKVWILFRVTKGSIFNIMNLLDFDVFFNVS